MMNRLKARVLIKTRNFLLPQRRKEKASKKKSWIKFEVKPELKTNVKISDQLIFQRYPSKEYLYSTFFNAIYSGGSLRAIELVTSQTNQRLDAKPFLYQLLDEINKHRYTINTTPTFRITTDSNGNLTQENIESFIYSVSHKCAFAIIESLIPWIHAELYKINNELKSRTDFPYNSFKSPLFFNKKYQYAIEIFDALWHDKAISGSNKLEMVKFLQWVFNIEKDEKNYKATLTNARKNPSYLNALKTRQDDRLHGQNAKGNKLPLRKVQ